MRPLLGFCLVFFFFKSSFLSCWGAVRHLVPTQREKRCQLCSLSRSLKSHSEWLTHRPTLHPRWLLLLHVYPLKLITTCKAFLSEGAIPGAPLPPSLFQATHTSLYLWVCFRGKKLTLLWNLALWTATSVAPTLNYVLRIVTGKYTSTMLSKENFFICHFVAYIKKSHILTAFTWI